MKIQMKVEKTVSKCRVGSRFGRTYYLSFIDFRLFLCFLELVFIEMAKLIFEILPLGDSWFGILFHFITLKKMKNIHNDKAKQS